MTAPILPDLIRVERSVDDSVTVLIDGKALPLAFVDTPDHPVTVDVVRGQAPGVRLTLIAKTVEVADQLLADAALPGHEREPDDGFTVATLREGGGTDDLIPARPTG